MDKVRVFKRPIVRTSFIGFYIVLLFDFWIKFTIYKRDYQDVLVYYLVPLVVATFLLAAHFTWLIFRPPLLETSAEGIIVYCYFFKSIRFKWSQIQGFRIAEFDDALDSPDFLGQLLVSFIEPINRSRFSSDFRLLNERSLMVNTGKSKAQVEYFLNLLIESRPPIILG